MENTYENMFRDIVLREYLLEEIGDDLHKLIEEENPLSLDEFEGKVFMRGTCGNKPCKGNYQ
jgi:hypothetical protein